MKFSPTYLEVGARIRNLREGLGWTQADLGGEAGMHRVMISRMECGDHALRLRDLLTVARALGVHVTRLLMDDEEPVEDPDPRVLATLHGPPYYGGLHVQLPMLAKGKVATVATPIDSYQPPSRAHAGGDAEDCPGCENANPPHPFICPEADRPQESS